MVFMGDRRPEHRENTITGGLRDVAAVATDGVDHQFQRRINDTSRLFRIEVFHQLGRSPDVSEEHGDRLALALDVFGCCRVSYPNWFSGFLNRRCDRGPAFFAESRAWTYCGFACRTDQLQLRPALLAKCSVRWFVCLAGGTLHASIRPARRA